MQYGSLYFIEKFINLSNLTSKTIIFILNEELLSKEDKSYKEMFGIKEC